MNLEFSREIFNKFQKLNFMNIRPVGPSFCMRTDRHGKANSRFPQFCERA
jgi:hypothetical protein